MPFSKSWYFRKMRRVGHRWPSRRLKRSRRKRRLDNSGMWDNHHHLSSPLLYFHGHQVSDVKMIRRRQGLSNCLFPQYTSILLSSWNHQISKITSFESGVMVLFVCNMQIMRCNQCHTWLTNLLNYYNYMLKAKDYNVLYYFLKKKKLWQKRHIRSYSY